MDGQRRFLSWSLALLTAVSLMFAGIRAAQSGLDALKQLTLFNLTLFATDMRDTAVLAGIALLAGTCAILIAPWRATIAYRITSNSQRKGVRVRDADLQPGASRVRLVRIDTRTRGDKAAAHRRPLTSELPNSRMKRPA
jgi:hypothetical protein